MAPVYEDFVKQAYIDPIRTVVVVDDAFPTLDGILDAGKITTEPAANELVRKLLDVCRGRERPWLVDVHDGTNLNTEEEKVTVGHLQHTDLLVLDYHLDPTKPTDGTRAIEILREMAQNDHFNLVIVYTAGGEQPGSDIDKVVREIVIGLSSYDDYYVLEGKGFEHAHQLVEAWTDEDPDIDDKLVESVDENVFLRVAQKKGLNWCETYALPELAQTKQIIDSSKYKGQWKSVLKWALHERQESLRAKYSDTDLGPLRFNADDDGINWIRTERLFITVVSKTNEPSTLPTKLQEALNLWDPCPHRLLLTKMRAELDERGVLAEAEVLGNRPLQAGWLDEFLAEDEGERAWKINSNLERHWESLGGEIRKNLSSFSSALANHLVKDGRLEAIERFSPLPKEADRPRIVAELNRYACSKPVEGTHLNTGHVFQTNFADSDEYWVCLSPACDLVPGQKSGGWFKRLGSHLPFVAVQLQECTEEKALETAHDGNFLFLEVNGEKQAFSFVPLVSGKEPNPKWEQFFAENQGRFATSFSFRIQRITETSGSLTRTPMNATVVSQLRYEYALNLLQRLGGNLSRVGLEFQPFIAPNG